MELSKSIVRYTQGIPLVLELIGSGLFGKPISEWKYIFDSYLSHGEDDQSIWRLLHKISYEGLDDDVKTVFLDIACCFNGYKVDFLTDLFLNARGFSPTYALQVLISKSLIKIDGGVVRMHDTVQMIGRSIVKEEPPIEPGKRSRLWYYEDILDVLKNNTGGPAVEIMKIDLPKDKQVLWDGNGFKNMENLKILEIINARFSEVPKIFANSLKVLNWKGYFGGANQ
ncbi:disease resistance protein RPP2B-like isoform X2 [Lotus japonicus]|nr:disease resistance protein RPP2B-like isoform X2 [Lotus japonicus]